MKTLTDFKTLADEWAWQEKEARRNAAVDACFAHTRPHDLIRIWETGKRLDGKKLSDIEFEGLVAAWLRVFGEWPPFDDDDDDNAEEPQALAAPEPELPADDTMLGKKEVLRLTGVSDSTLKRMTLDGRFPKPMHLSLRRIGWPAGEVKAWIEGLDGARRKARR